jgi:hypothetical protein
MLRRGTVLVLLVSILALAGCSSRGPALPPTVAARGKVLLANGQPLRGGRIELHKLDPKTVDAFADVGNDGSFVLTTYQPDDGAVPGRYVVTISPYNYKDKSGNPVKLANAGQIPSKYLESETSDVQVDIAQSDNVLEVKLK